MESAALDLSTGSPAPVEQRSRMERRRQGVLDEISVAGLGTGLDPEAP